MTTKIFSTGVTAVEEIWLKGSVTNLINNNSFFKENKLDKYPLYIKYLTEILPKLKYCL